MSFLFAVVLLLVCGAGAVRLDAQQAGGGATAQFAAAHLAELEHILTATSTLSGTAQKDYLQHLGLSADQQSVLLQAAQGFAAQEDLLRKSAQQSLEGLPNPNSASSLTHVRSQRAQLLLTTATTVFQTLNTTAANQLMAYIVRIEAHLPSRLVQ
jgi:hypothetical protein